MEAGCPGCERLRVQGIPQSVLCGGPPITLQVPWPPRAEQLLLGALRKALQMPVMFP